METVISREEHLAQRKAYIKERRAIRAAERKAKPRNKVVAVYMDLEIYEELKAFAAKKGDSLSGYLRSTAVCRMRGLKPF